MMFFRNNFPENHYFRILFGKIMLCHMVAINFFSTKNQFLKNQQFSYFHSFQKFLPKKFYVPHRAPRIEFLPKYRCFRTFSNFDIFQKFLMKLFCTRFLRAKLYVPGGILLLLHRPINLFFQIRTNFRKSKGGPFPHEMAPPLDPYSAF